MAMREFDKLRAIVAREFLERVRTKWFIIFTLLGPVLLSAISSSPCGSPRATVQGRARVRWWCWMPTGAGLGERVRQQLAAPAQGLPPAIAGSAGGAVPVEVRAVAPEALAAAESTVTRG
jgi:ABC-2 type transport system permease protein